MFRICFDTNIWNRLVILAKVKYLCHSSKGGEHLQPVHHIRRHFPAQPEQL